MERVGEERQEIRRKISDVSKELIDALALTEEETKRYETDENLQREVARSVNEVTDKLNEVYRMRRKHEAKRPLYSV